MPVCRGRQLVADRAQMRAAPEASKAIKKLNSPLNHNNISRVAAFLTKGGS